MDLFTAIHRRRSHVELAEPAPGTEDLEKMIAAATAAPDHGRRVPWRFVILQGDGKDAFADVIEKACRTRTPGPADTKVLTRERSRLDRAPLIVVTVSLSGPGDRIPRHERFAATAAATQNLLLAATALGYGSIWRTGWLADNLTTKQALGLTAEDDIVGFVYLGTVPHDRPVAVRARRPATEICWTWPHHT